MSAAGDPPSSETPVKITAEKNYAAGVPAVLVSLRRGFEQMGWDAAMRSKIRSKTREHPEVYKLRLLADLWVVAGLAETGWLGTRCAP